MYNIFMYCVVYVTVPDRESADKLSEVLIRERLAACVNVVDNVNSVFHWQGRVDKGSELLLIIKTKQDLFERLAKEVKAIHPYEVPEIIAMPIIAIDDDYASWFSSCVD